jgi:uncharacterized radical SAM superfamily protein
MNSLSCRLWSNATSTACQLSSSHTGDDFLRSMISSKRKRATLTGTPPEIVTSQTRMGIRTIIRSGSDVSVIRAGFVESLNSIRIVLPSTLLQAFFMYL